MLNTSCLRQGSFAVILLIGLLGWWQPVVLAQDPPLSGRITNDASDDPYAAEKRWVRQQEYDIDDFLAPEFQAEPKAKLEEVKSALMAYISATEKYKDALDEASLPADPNTKQQKREAARKAGIAATEARDKYDDAKTQFNRAKGLAHQKQEIAEKQRRRAGANQPIDQGNADPTAPADPRTPNDTPGAPPADPRIPASPTPPSRTGADESQADPNLQRISGFLEAYDEAIKQDLAGNILMAPVQILGGKIKTVGKLLEIVGKAGALEQVMEDLNQPIDPNESPKDQGRRFGKLFYDGLNLRDAMKSPGGLDGHGAGNPDAQPPVAHGNEPPPEGAIPRPDVPFDPTAIPPPSPPQPPGGGGNTPPVRPAPRGYPGDFGRASGTTSKPKIPDDPASTPQMKQDYAQGETAGFATYKEGINDPQGIWDQSGINSPYHNQTTGQTHPGTLGQRLGDFQNPNSTYGKTARDIDLRGKTPQQIYDEMTSKGFQHVRQSYDVQPKGDPVYSVAHDIYWHPDGSIVRVKPNGWPGNEFRAEPHASKGVMFDLTPGPDGVPDLSFGNEAFKVTNNGVAVPAATIPNKGFRDVAGEMNPHMAQGYKDYLMGIAHTNVDNPAGR